MRFCVVLLASLVSGCGSNQPQDSQTDLTALKVEVENVKHGLTRVQNLESEVQTLKVRLRTAERQLQELRSRRPVACEAKQSNGRLVLRPCRTLGGS